MGDFAGYYAKWDRTLLALSLALTWRDVPVLEEIRDELCLILVLPVFSPVFGEQLPLTVVLRGLAPENVVITD